MYENIVLCPLCCMPCVCPEGPEDSTILLVGAYPGNEEMKEGKPWVGKGGEIFKRELAIAGLNYQRCRVTNLWLHPKSKDLAEKDWHLKQLLNELEGKTHVLLMGADVCELFTGGKIGNHESTKIKSKLLPKSVKSAWIMRNPANAALRGSTIGDIRLTIQKFASEVKSHDRRIDTTNGK